MAISSSGGKWGGVALCVRDCFDCIELNDCDDKVECLWVKMRGKANKADILLGVCYRPPNQDEEAHEVFYKRLAEVSQSLTLVLMGDFNLPDMCWKYNTAEWKESRRFLECVEDNFSMQLVSEPSRGGASLDLLFTNREGLVGDVVVRGRLALSDHEMLEFSFMMKRGASKTTIMDFWRAEFGLFRMLVEGVHWERVLKGKGVQEGWTFFKEEVLKAQEQAVSMCHKTNQWGRRQAWLNREILLGLRKNRRVYHLWKKGQVTQEEYRGLARSCREEIRKAKAQLELRLATVIRDKKNVFTNTLTTKKGPRRVSIPYWMQGAILPTRMRKRLKHFTPSLPESLIVRLVIPRVVRSQCWKIGKESGTNLLQSRMK